MTILYFTPEESAPLVNSARSLIDQLPGLTAEEIIQAVRAEMVEQVGHSATPQFIDQLTLPLRQAVEMILQDPAANDVLLARKLSQWSAEQVQANPLNENQINALVSSSFEYVVASVLKSRKETGELDDAQTRALENNLTMKLFDQLETASAEFYPGDEDLLEQACEEAAKLIGILVRNPPEEIQEIVKDNGLPSRLPAFFTLASAKLRVGRSNLSPPTQSAPKP